MIAAVGGGTADAADGAGRAPGVSSPDAGFARDMAVHHQQAVEMSFIVRDRTGDEAVRSLAYDIANTQANQRGMLLGWLDLWGLPKVTPGEPPMSWMTAGAADGHDMAGMHAAPGTDGAATPGAEGAAQGGAVTKPGALMPGMATKEELARLDTLRDRDAEVLYLQLMTDHHKGGVAMALGCARLCRTPAEQKLAQGMAEAQRSELSLMADMLGKRGAAPRP
ncbi:DUF305 domain-containing protein [Streptomyces sp. NPDC006529]|uniref:DUF305 domain-containing protein n=1 Tax=Streptomyces sp. NPDC006529 TaxID=3157177 RepID=UPI00339E0E52